MPFNIKINSSYSEETADDLKNVMVFQSSSTDEEAAKTMIGDQVAEIFNMKEKSYDPHGNGICLDCYIDGKHRPYKDLGVKDNFDVVDFVRFLTEGGVRSDLEYEIVSLYKDKNRVEEHFIYTGSVHKEALAQLRDTMNFYYEYKKEAQFTVSK